MQDVKQIEKQNYLVVIRN